MQILAAKAATPSASNNLRKRLMKLMDHALALEWRKDNPVKLVKPYRIEGDGYHTWTEAEIARFYEFHEPGTMAHLCVTLMLYTGVAKVDAVKLGHENVVSGRTTYVRQKTVKSNGVVVSIPLHPDLAAVLENCADGRPFLATAYGEGRSVNGLGNSMRAWCDAAGLPQCPAHGLRKACARRLAEAGATAPEIMSVTGHKTLAEVDRYIRDALREGMADSAMEKLIARPNRARTLANPPEKFAENEGRSMKIKDKNEFW
ncbi:MAG: tyrosine-type recombinase/integrase [Paracoccaceae bacterium]|nr:tyrosine-type recombinase/integrase [Paracoccaceae bacterium]